MPSDPKGCLISIEGDDRKFLLELGDAFKAFDHDSTIVDRQIYAGGSILKPLPLHGPRYALTFEQRGNLEMEGWFAWFARNLEDICTDAATLDLGSHLNIDIRLVYN